MTKKQEISARLVETWRHRDSGGPSPSYTLQWPSAKCVLSSSSNQVVHEICRCRQGVQREFAAATIPERG